MLLEIFKIQITIQLNLSRASLSPLSNPFPQQLLGKKLLLVSNFPSPRTHNLPRSLRIPIEVSPVSERWFQVLALETEADSPGKKAFRIKSERRFPAEMRDAGADDIGVHVSSSRVGRPAARWSDRERHSRV